jgi:hypothetical protein
VGEVINLTFFWNLISSQTADYTLYITLTTPHGGIVNEISKPIADWHIEDLIVDAHDLSIPVTAAPGAYQIRVTFFNSNGERLPILDIGRGQQDNIGSLILRSIEIVP